MLYSFIQDYPIFDFAVSNEKYSQLSPLNIDITLVEDTEQEAIFCGNVLLYSEDYLNTIFPIVRIGML